MFYTEATRWHLRNINCKQAILGISHDAGYAPFLDEVLRDEETRRRITILEGFPTVRELVATGLNILSLNDTLFRSEKLIDRTHFLTTSSQLVAPALLASSGASLAGTAAAAAAAATTRAATAV